MLSRSWIPVPVLALAVGCAGAADIDDNVNDMRILFGLVTPSYDVKGADSSVSSRPRLGLQYLTTVKPGPNDIGSWIAGGEVAYASADDKGVKITTGVVDGMGGYAYPLPQMPHLHFEGTLFVGIGESTVNVAGDKNSDVYLEYGLRVAGLYTFDNRWQVGAEIRFMAGRTTSDIANTSHDVNDDGVMLGLLAGRRF